MKIEMESTTKIVEFNGVPARVWIGFLPNGAEVYFFVTRVALDNENSNAEDKRLFAENLQLHRPPTADLAFIPLRMIL